MLIEAFLIYDFGEFLIYQISYAETTEAQTYMDLRFGANSKLLHSAAMH
jgi:hypothetical protein